jgi:hypothetical protein
MNGIFGVCRKPHRSSVEFGTSNNSKAIKFVKPAKQKSRRRSGARR